jgi:hypothetical protein
LGISISKPTSCRVSRRSSNGVERLEDERGNLVRKRGKWMRGLNWLLAGTLASTVLFAGGTALGHGYQDDPAALMETPTPETLVTFGNENQFVLSAQRITGLAWTNARVNNPDGSKAYSFTDVELSFFQAPNQNPFSIQVASPMGVVDYFVIPNLSIGVGVSFIFGKPKRTDAAAGDNFNHQEFGFTGSGRVGYAFNLGEVLTIWPHVGVAGAYTKLDTKTDNGPATTKHRSTAMWVMLDCTILARLGEGYGVTFLPEVAIPVLGHTDDSQGNRQDEYKAYVVGGTFGFAFWF